MRKHGITLKQKKMGVLAGIIPATILLLLLASNSYAQSASLYAASNFKLKDLAGRELALKDFRGKIVVLIVGELHLQNTLKAINDVKKILSEKHSYRDAVEVLLIISESKSPEECLKLKNSFNINYPVLLDNDRNVYAQYEIRAIPTTLIISSIGMVAARLASYTLSYYDQVDAELGFLLGETNQEELDKVMHPKAEVSYVNGKSERLISLAENLRKKGFYDSAMDSYRKVLEKNPGLKEAHLGLGCIYLEQRAVKMAEKEFNAVLDKNPDDPAALKGMAQVYLLRGNTDQAEAIMRKVILSSNVDDDTYYVMGMIYEEQGRLREALNFYKKNCQKLLQKR